VAVCVGEKREKIIRKEFYGFLHGEKWRGPFSPGLLGVLLVSLLLCAQSTLAFTTSIHQFISGITVTVTLLPALSQQDFY
jgi:hypothetical protein